MQRNDDDDLRADPRLAAALRELDPPPPEVDWERLQARIVESAALPLARRRRASRLRNPGVWTGLAASAAAVLLVVQMNDGPGGSLAANGAAAVDTGRVPAATVEEVVRASLPAVELDRLISGSAEREALLYAAVGHGEMMEL